MALTITFDADKNQIKTRLYMLNNGTAIFVQSYMRDKAKELETYMKKNHKWRNRTGMAEKKLSAKLGMSPKSYSQAIVLSHGVYYGVYLEYSFGRRYAIIEPTIRLKGPQIVSELRGKLDMIPKVRTVGFL